MTRCRRLRIFFTVITLLLLQVFNDVDWNCFSGPQQEECGEGCHAEHRLGVVCQPDMIHVLEQAYQQIFTEPEPFFFLSRLMRKHPVFNIRNRSLVPEERSSGPPSGECVPLRC